MKKTITALFVIAMLSGCAWLDKNVGNNDGEFNPQFSLTWVDAEGNPYKLAYDENGVLIEGTFTGPKTGFTYKVTDGEGITITDPVSGAVLIVSQQEE